MTVALDDCMLVVERNGTSMFAVFNEEQWILLFRWVAAHSENGALQLTNMPNQQLFEDAYTHRARELDIPMFDVSMHKYTKAMFFVKQSQTVFGVRVAHELMLSMLDYAEQISTNGTLFLSELPNQMFFDVWKVEQTTQTKSNVKIQ